MSITDSSTELSTTWTEQSYVAFTSGTLASVSDCLTEVQSKLKRGTLSTSTNPSTTEVYRWLIRAKQELAETKGYSWKRRYAYCSTVASTYRYALPPDFNGGMVRIKDTTNDRFIELYSPSEFDSVYPDPSAETNDEVLFGCIKNMELWLAPPPSGVFVLEIEYDRSGDDNDVSSSADFSWLPEIERFRCCDFALAEAFESLHMWEVSDRFRNKFAQGIGKAIRADARRKWHSMNFRARSWQEQHDYINYQPGS
jgi:hypothetical protein